MLGRQAAFTGILVLLYIAGSFQHSTELSTSSRWVCRTSRQSRSGAWSCLLYMAASLASGTSSQHHNANIIQYIMQV